MSQQPSPQENKTPYTTRYIETTQKLDDDMSEMCDFVATMGKYKSEEDVEVGERLQDLSDRVWKMYSSVTKKRKRDDSEDEEDEEENDDCVAAILIRAAMNHINRDIVTDDDKVSNWSATLEHIANDINMVHDKRENIEHRESNKINPTFRFDPSLFGSR